VSYHDWIPLVVKRLGPQPSCRPLPIVALTPDVRVEHREGWVTEAVVYHFDIEARRVVFAPL
jgi:hypothetical protein